MCAIAIIEKAAAFGERPALRQIKAEGSCDVRYSELLDASASLAARLLDGRQDLREERVALLVAPGAAYVVAQWGIWRAGGIAVPLATSHPAAEMAHVIDDAGARTIVVDSEFEGRVVSLATDERPLRCVRLGTDLGVGAHATLPDVDPGRRAILVYTSGSTGRPKGAVWTHEALAAEVQAMIDSWGWTRDDHVLHTLPLHHVHGIFNLLLTPLSCGALCEFLPGATAERIWSRFTQSPPGLTLFMAVPTVYARLVKVWDESTEDAQRRMSAAAARLRLVVSGSAALSPNLFERWREITGETILERYGMTEIGMALTNPLDGERRRGCVGAPFPGMDVRVADDSGRALGAGASGELQVRGQAMFLEYWERPSETAASYTADGWFKTGDEALLESGSYRILGRRSTDMLKSGGYKISALEVEEVLLSHAAIAECAVVGLEDEEWGERVAAAIVLAPGQAIDLESLRAWAKAHLAPYKIPTRLRVVAALPRTALGKIQKRAVVAAFEAAG